jgi:Cupredoxin-like domain
MRVAPSGGVVRASTLPNQSVSRAVQPIIVDASSGVLSPNQIAVKADAPSEVAFTSGRRCTEHLYLEDLAIEITLGRYGATLRLPPLQAGTYPITCAHGNVIGLLIAQ